MAGELKGLKSELAVEAGQWIEDCDHRLRLLESLLNQRRTLIAALSISPEPPNLEGRRIELLHCRESLTEPYRRSAVADLLARIDSVQKAAVEDVDKWHGALKAVERRWRRPRRFQRAVPPVDVFDRPFWTLRFGEQIRAALRRYGSASDSRPSSSRRLLSRSGGSG